MSVNPSVVPAPWKLNGSGVILLYRFNTDFIRQHANIPPDLQSRYVGGLGAVMLVDYRTSPVGGYRELLFIPGRFKWGRQRYYVITQIYVSTLESVVSGQENWGIPKQLADFDIQQPDTNTRRFIAHKDGTPFFDATVESGILRFPFNTWVSPFRAILLQERERDGAHLATEPSAGGVVSPTATLSALQVDGAHFPDASQFKPLGTLEAVNFRMTFPLPKQVAAQP